MDSSLFFCGKMIAKQKYFVFFRNILHDTFVCTKHHSRFHAIGKKVIFWGIAVPEEQPLSPLHQMETEKNLLPTAQNQELFICCWKRGESSFSNWASQLNH
uniref:Uncharacterized protein n=2 Tax=Micrurus TaxID=8634 RepID=A0A2D4H4M3_MICCO